MRVLQAISQGTDNSQVISACKMLILKERQWKKAGSPVLHLLWRGFLLAFTPAALPTTDSARIPLMCSMTRDKHHSFPVEDGDKTPSSLTWGEHLADGKHSNGFPLLPSPQQRFFAWPNFSQVPEPSPRPVYALPCTIQF